MANDGRTSLTDTETDNLHFLYTPSCHERVAVSTHFQRYAPRLRPLNPVDDIETGLWLYSPVGSSHRQNLY